MAGEAFLAGAIAMGGAKAEASEPKPQPEAVKVTYTEATLTPQSEVELEGEPDLATAEKDGDYLVGENFIAYPVPNIRSYSLARSTASARLRTYVARQEGWQTSNNPRFMEKDGVMYAYMAIKK